MNIKKITLISALFLTACVTINIYFPAAAAEKVADEIIQDIQGVAPDQSKSKVVPQPHLSEWQVSIFRLVDQALSVVISSAHAEVNLPADSPEIRRIRASMRTRFSVLKVYYDQGAIGIQSDGLLTQKGKVSLKDRNKVKKLIKAENMDRNNLYKAIANANNHPEWVAQIKSTFAVRWISNAQPGWWYQLANGSWKQK